MKQVLCFGDSNTWGYNGATKGRYAWEDRWTGILQDRLADRKVHIIEEGLVGRTCVFDDALRPGRRGSDILPILLETHTPDVIILMLGTNDCKATYNASAQVIGRGIEFLLQQIRDKAPHAKVLLLSPIHLGDTVWKEEYDPEFNPSSVSVSHQLKEVYRTIAQSQTDGFLAASDYADPGSDDQEHLSVAGHHQLADAIYGALLPLLDA